jgi:hypothetical protein
LPHSLGEHGAVDNLCDESGFAVESLSLQQRVCNLETIITCSVGQSGACSFTGDLDKVNSDKLDDNDWGPFQNANDWAADETWMSLEREFVQCTSTSTLRPEAVVFLPASSADVLAMECTAASVIQRVWRRCFRRRQPAADPAADKKKKENKEQTLQLKREFKSRCVIHRERRYVRPDVEEFVLPGPVWIMADFGIAGVREEGAAIRCESCADVQPVDCPWMTSFTKLITFSKGVERTRHYCRACGTPSQRVSDL